METSLKDMMRISQRKSRTEVLVMSQFITWATQKDVFSRILSSTKLQFRCNPSGPTSVREPKGVRKRFVSCKMTAKRNQTFCEQYFGGG